MNFFDIESWLSNHSLKREANGTEIVFTHASKESSILLPRSSLACNVIPFESEPLRSFYAKFYGASIGNSQIMIATNIVGGLKISHGYHLLDLNQMTEQAKKIGIIAGHGEQVCIAEAAWMFIYSLAEEQGRTVLREYDRDYRTCRIVGSLSEVFDSWWKIVEDDLGRVNTKAQGVDN